MQREDRMQAISEYRHTMACAEVGCDLEPICLMDNGDPLCAEHVPPTAEAVEIARTQWQDAVHAMAAARSLECDACERYITVAAREERVRMGERDAV